MIRRIYRWVAVAATGGVLILFPGCSNEPDWRDNALSEKADKQAFKEDLESQGMSERQAAAAWREKRSREDTEGYDPYR